MGTVPYSGRMGQRVELTLVSQNVGRCRLSIVFTSAGQ